MFVVLVWIGLRRLVLRGGLGCTWLSCSSGRLSLQCCDLLDCCLLVADFGGLCLWCCLVAVVRVFCYVY